MAYSLVAHTAALGTTAGINCTGADFLAAYVVGDDETDDPVDSLTNTWTPLTKADDGSNTIGRWWYVQAPSVGAGQTFAVSQGYRAILVLAFSGSTSTPVDQQDGSASSGSQQSAQAAGVTPGFANELVLAAVGNGNATSTYTIDSGFTITDSVNAVQSVNYGGSAAYLIQTTATLTDPTFSWLGGATMAFRVATFKAAAGGATTWGPLLGLKHTRLVGD
jgi:hypothetical protein